MAWNSSTPSRIGRWKVLRPEIRPEPPARLLTTAVRTAFRSDLAALAETVPGYALVYWLAVFAPTATPKPIQKTLCDAIAEALKDPTTGKAMTQGRMEISPLGLDDFAAYVKSETGWWTKSIKEAGIEPG